MSNNKIKDTCDDFACFNIITAHNIDLKLSLNRLSGDFPSAFYSIDNLDVLEGNLFGCSSSRLSQDLHVDSVTCGSSSLDDSLYFMFASIGLLLIATIYCRHVFSDVIVKLYKSYCLWRDNYLADLSTELHFLIS